MRGTVYALDIEAEMVNGTAQRVRAAEFDNVRVEQRDFVVEGTGLPNASVDYVMLFNILHCEQPRRLLSEAAKVTRPGGFVYAIHWRFDPRTPRGPSMDIRLRPEQVAAWSAETRRLNREGDVVALPGWHYG